MSLRIEDYALIGDCETAALVGTNGSIDWLCWPDFSSSACFAALLGTKKNGRWIIAPKDKIKKVTRKYREHSLILETILETSSGAVLLTDFMPVRERHSDVVRIVRCLHGRMSMRMELCVRFDYGRTIPWTGPREGNAWAAAGGMGVVYLRTQQPLHTEENIALAEFTLTQGNQRSFTLTYVDANQPPPRRINVQKAFRQTESFWQKWCGLNRYEGPWKDAVERSLITLKALTYRPSGGIVAAPTTSLPERLGADRNWDYRYCWLRDAAFTLESLLSVGYHDEARAWQQWLLQSVGSDVRQMQIVYGMRGERHLPECELPWLPGYRMSRPVRIGNAAFEQVQLDVYGGLADALYSMRRANINLDPHLCRLKEEMTDYVASISDRRAWGMWEEREQQRKFTYSEVMAWVAIKHGIKAAESGEIHGNLAAWKRKLARLHKQICRHGFNRMIGSFVQSFDSRKLDASSLLIPLFGFLPFQDERIQSTVRTIEKKLTTDGLVLREQPKSRQDRESAFLACSFWLVQNLVGVGRRPEAERLYERLLNLRNDVGLLPEEYDPHKCRFVGNFPQALSHIALVNAGRALANRP